jgi:polyphosphate kinase 2 (PPK2 family)
MRLDDVDLSPKLSADEGARRLAAAQRRLLALRLQLGGLIGDGQLGPPVCVLFEGWDASGKGGCIKRLVAPLDPRHVRVAQFAAPTPDERRHHFLWRFWPALPGWGGMAVFDRSWYGRVLVERVEKLTPEYQWRRAYDQIGGFERSLAEEGMVLVKLFLHISSKEQLKRFRAREADPLKRWKLTDEDWRNRKHRRAYLAATEDMFEFTDTPSARWGVIAAESKHYARVAVVQTVIERIEAGMRVHGIEPTRRLA